MKKSLTPEGLTNAASWAYSKAISKIPMLGSAEDLAEDYRKLGKPVHACVDSLIRWQCTKAAHNGFWLGLPGAAGAPLAIPADITQSMYIQLRMVAAIAHLYGHNVHSDHVRTCALVCLCGSKATDILASAGIKFGQRLAINAIKAVQGKVLIEINKKVGMRLFTKFGEKGIINLGKFVPLVGGVFSAGANGFGTHMVGKTAKLLLGN